MSLTLDGYHAARCLGASLHPAARPETGGAMFPRLDGHADHLGDPHMRRARHGCKNDVCPTDITDVAVTRGVASPKRNAPAFHCLPQ